MQSVSESGAGPWAWLSGDERPHGKLLRVSSTGSCCNTMSRVGYVTAMDLGLRVSQTDHQCLNSVHNNKKPSYRRDSASRWSLRRSRSFKVTDFGTDQCQFDTRLTLTYILSLTVVTVSRLLQSIGRICAFDRGYLSLTHSFRVNLLISYLAPFPSYGRLLVKFSLAKVGASL